MDSFLRFPVCPALVWGVFVILGEYKIRLVFLLGESVVRQDIQQHECGEYALEQLQQGRSAAEVVDLLLERYLSLSLSLLSLIHI